MSEVREVRPAVNDVINKTETLRLARRARELLERGWCQGPLAKRRRWFGSGLVRTSLYGAAATHFCVMGAFARAGAEQRSVDFRPHYRQFERAALAPGGFGGLVAYSEAPGRTQQEVLALIDRGIARLEVVRERENKR